MKYTKENDRKQLIILGSLAVLLLLAIGLGIRSFVSGEVNFIGHETVFVKAVITDTNIFPVHRGYKQKVKFEYFYKDKMYTGESSVGRDIGLRKVGGSLKLKISKDKPQLFKVINYYKLTF